jgi:hypothetical protein
MLRVLWGALALAQASLAQLPYTDTNSEVALRNLRTIGERDPASLSEAEGVEWVRARFAWVALLRLQGNEKGALAVFAGCGDACGKWGPSSEWAALKKWGCERKKEPFCQ